MDLQRHNAAFLCGPCKLDERDLKCLRALMGDQKVRQAVVVSQDARIRGIDKGIMIYPWQTFCEKLWAGDLIP